MSLGFRLLLLFSLLNLFVVVTPMKMKAQIAPFAAANQEATLLQDESPETFEIELHLPVTTAFVSLETAHPVTFEPPALESILLEAERPKPRV